jgi:hypothetical protein
LVVAKGGTAKGVTPARTLNFPADWALGSRPTPRARLGLLAQTSNNQRQHRNSLVSQQIVCSAYPFHRSASRASITPNVLTHCSSICSGPFDLSDRLCACPRLSSRPPGMAAAESWLTFYHIVGTAQEKYPLQLRGCCFTEWSAVGERHDRHERRSNTA